VGRGGAHRRACRALAGPLAAALLAACTPSPTAPPGGAPPPAVDTTRSFAPVVAAVRPAVVAIAAERTRPSPLRQDPRLRRFPERFGGDAPAPQRQTSLGSGVIVDPSGVVVTNHHVVKDAEVIAVILSDGETVGAEVVRVEPSSDLALLRLDAGGRLPTVAIGDSDALEPGDFVLAVGNPFGVGQSVSSGIVSAVGRRPRGLGLDVPLIQTDAAINPGNSGGPLVDVRGRLVGINTAILTRSGGSMGVGFAIPANALRMELEALRTEPSS